tara:strand:+ start:10431 stop:10586 length:156 start_codon:yes stop_codon:yes gene_type:complete
MPLAHFEQQLPKLYWNVSAERMDVHTKRMTSVILSFGLVCAISYHELPRDI